MAGAGMTGLAFWRKRLNGEPVGVAEPVDLIEPTDEEASNGWTAEALTEYVAEIKKAEFETAFRKRRFRPKWANSKYHPHRWRRAVR